VGSTPTGAFSPWMGVEADLAVVGEEADAMSTMIDVLTGSLHETVAAAFAPGRWHHDINAAIVDRHTDFLLTRRQRSRRYPSRLLRYFIPFHWIGREAVARERPVRVCEIGIAHGLMLRYMLHGFKHLGISRGDVIDRWVGVDMELLHEHLDPLPYDELIEANAETDLDRVDLDCDVCVLLHVLEHLYEPERMIERLVSRLPSGTVLIAGFPAHPHAVIPYREPHLRAHTNANGHVSALSTRRFVEAARANGCDVVESRSAFFMRASGMFLEDSRTWQRFNMAWGGTFPGWLGEAYIAVRKR
jgi:2-polyprenyl-3-methyl-5-hydroxy-6-metoxy-1,4-benzoquinol methylase